jgi:predicted dehydrogenase
LKVAQIGYGHLGKWHAQKAKNVYGDNFVAIVEVDESRHEEICKEYPSVKVTSDFDEIINDISAAIIVTPTSFHFSILEKCLQNNLHVFCEKPLTETFNQSEKVKKLLTSRKDLKLQVGHSERFHRCWGELKDSLGNSEMLRLTRRAPYKGRGADVDIVQDLMIHDFDLINYFLEEVPLSIHASGKKIISNNYDYVSAHLTYKGNRSAFVTASRVSTDEQREVIAVLPEGELKVDLLKNEIQRSNCFDGVFSLDSSSYEKSDHLLKEHEYFLKSITENVKPVIGIDDAITVMKMIDLTIKSLESGEIISWE